MESIENVNDYHSVFARSIETCLNALLNKGEKEAKIALIFNIRYSYVQWKDLIEPEISLTDIEKELEDLKLSDLKTEQLISMMSYYNAKAKMKPVQNTDQKAKVFEKLRNRW